MTFTYSLPVQNATARIGQIMAEKAAELLINNFKMPADQVAEVINDEFGEIIESAEKFDAMISAQEQREEHRRLME